MPEEKDYISNVHKALVQKVEGFDVPEQEFRTKMQDENYIGKVHNALTKKVEGFDLDINDFQNRIGIKKKEETPSTSGGAYVRPLSQGGGEPAQSFSEATLGRLSDDQFRARKEAEANRQKAIEREQARVRKEQFYSNVKPIAQSTAEDIDLFAPNNSLPSTGEIYQTLKQIEINKAKGFQYIPKPITQPLASDVTKTTITPRLIATLSEEERNRQLALKAKEKEEETSLTETKEEATPLQKTLTLASNVAKGAIGVGRDFAQVGDLLIRKGIENTFEGEPKKYKPEVQGIIDRVRGYNLQRGDEAFEKDLGQYFYEHPEYKKSDAAQTARGLGQVIPSVVVGLLTGGTGVFAQTAIQGTLSGTQIFNEAYKRAKEYGTDDETAIKTAFLDAVGESYIDAFPTLKLLNRFNKTVGGGFWNKAKQSAKEAGIAFVEGGTSEGLQKIVSNAIASYNYDDNVALLDDVFEEGKIGGFTQSLLSLGLSAIKHARVKAKTPQQKAELDKKEASLYDAIKNQNIVSPPMEGEAQPPAEGGAPSPTPTVGGTDIAVEETLEDKKAKAGESLRNLLGKVATEEKIVTPQGEEPLVEGNTPEEIATNIQVKLNDIKTKRAKILGGLPKDESGKRIKNDEAQAQLDDLEEQEFRLQEYDSQNKQRVSGEVGEGQKPIEAQPVGAGSEEAVAPSGVFQAPTQEVIIPDTPAGHVTAVMDNPTADNVQNLADNAVSLAQEVIKQGNDQGTIPQEKMPTVEKTPPVGKEPKESVVGGDVESKKKSFTEAVEQSKKDQSPKALGNFIIDNVQVGDRIKKNEDEYYEVVSRKVSKRNGSTEIELQHFIKNEETGNFENNPSAVKIFTDKYRGTDLEKLGYRQASDLFESVYTNSNGERVIEQSTYEPKDISEQSLKETSVVEAPKVEMPKVEAPIAEVAVAEAPKTKPTEALKDVESTAKALEGVDATKLGYVKYEDAIIVEPQVDFDNLPKGNDELSREARSQAIREQENKPPKYKKYPIGTRAVDRFGEVYELREVPLDEAISKNEGTQREATIDKYAEWIKQGNKVPPAKGVENFATEGGKVKITDGNHRYQAAKKAGLKTIPVWVALTDKKNTARPIYAKNEISEAYHADKAAGKETELTKAVEQSLKETPVAEAPKVEMPKVKAPIAKVAVAEAPKVEAVEDLLGKPLSDVQGEGKRSILGSDVDLKGKKKEGWMKLLDEWYNDKLASEGEQTTNEVQKFSDMLPKNPHEFASLKQHKDLPIVKDIIEHQKTIKNNILKINNAISEGSMTAEDAKTIIESAGLEVPKNILEMAKKESKSTSTTGQKASTETISEGWDKDVESTAKALDDVLSNKEVKVDKAKLKKVNNEISKLIDIDNKEPKLKKIKEQGGNWRKLFNESKDTVSQNSILRAVVETSNDVNFLNEAVDITNGLPDESNTIADILQKNISDNNKAEIVKKVLSGDYKKNTKFDVLNWLEYNKGIKRLIPKDLLKKFEVKSDGQLLSEAYHKAKADGSNPELVKAVEQLLGKPTEVAVAEAKPSKVTKEPAPQKAETKTETIEDKKAKAGESLRNLLGKTGVIKNIVPSEDSDTWNDIKNIADYIAAETGKKGKELIEAIKKYLKTNGGEAIIPQIETYEKRIIAESSQEGVETTEPTNIRIFEELDAMNEKRMGIGNRAKENKAFNEKHGNKAQLARDITNNFEKYIDKLKEEGIIVKVKC